MIFFPQWFFWYAKPYMICCLPTIEGASNVSRLIVQPLYGFGVGTAVSWHGRAEALFFMAVFCASHHRQDASVGSSRCMVAISPSAKLWELTLINRPQTKLWVSVLYLVRLIIPRNKEKVSPGLGYLPVITWIMVPRQVGCNGPAVFGQISDFYNKCVDFLKYITHRLEVWETMFTVPLIVPAVILHRNGRGLFS